jgi:hypothetical protein
VSSKFIDEFKMACSEEDRSQLKLMMGHVHVYVTAACKEYFDKFRRHVYVTPKSYLSFIQGYKELYSRKWAYTQELAASIQVGPSSALLTRLICSKLALVREPGSLCSVLTLPAHCLVGYHKRQLCVITVTVTGWPAKDG